jgi:hypothetical protein
VCLQPVRQHLNDLFAFLSPFKFTTDGLGFLPNQTQFGGS